MGLFSWFLKKRPVERVEGGELEIPAEAISAESAIKEEKSREQENERKEKMRRFIAKVSALMERIELLERKMDRVESRLGIKDEI